MTSFLPMLVSLICATLLSIFLALVEPGVSLISGADSLLTPFLDNLLTIALITLGFVCVWINKGCFRAVYTDQNKLSRLYATLMGATLSFILVSGFYHLYEAFAPIDKPRKLLLFAWVLPLGAGWLVDRLKPAPVAKTIWSTQAFLLILFIITLDISFHLGVHRNPFSGMEQRAYHWDLKRRPHHNYKNTPIHYLDEIRQLTGLIPANSRVLADTYTSYYLKSVLPVYAVNAKRHHRNHPEYSLDHQTMLLICSGLAEELAMEQFIKKLIALETDYLIINHDRQNSWIGTSCLAKNTATLEAYFANNHTTVFKGERLIVYKL